MNKKSLLFTLSLFFAISSLYASGFQINEHGARAMSMGGAFTGLANDPSTIYFNPAGMRNLSGTYLMAGATYIEPHASFRGPYPSVTEYQLEEQYFNPINFYAAHTINDKFAVGLSVNNPYGLGTRWESDWPGRFLAIDTSIETFFFQPTVSYAITDDLSIGAGLVIAYGTVKIQRNQELSPFNAEGQVDLDGDGTGIGFNAGIFYKPVDQFSLGLSYRSEVEIEFTGDAVIDAPSQFEGLLPAGSVKAPLTTPRNITFGAAYMPTECLTFTADFQYVGWESYDKLEITFEDAIDPETGEPTVSSSERNFNNSYIVRFGAEYKVMEKLDVRGGLFYDNNPIDDEYVDPTLPDSDRLGFNIGFGYDLLDNLEFSMAYLYLRFNEREITNSHVNYMSGDTPFNGTYNSYAHLLGANFTYKF